MEGAASSAPRTGGDGALPSTTAASGAAGAAPAEATAVVATNDDAPKTSTTDAVMPPAADTGATAIASRVHRRSIAGIDVLTLPTAIKDVVTIRGVLSGGDIFNPPDNAAIADLTAGMLDKGTTRHDKFALAALLEDTGAELNFGTGTHTLNFTGKCLRKDLPLVLGLLAEQLRTPRFDPQEFAKLKKQLIGERRHAMEDTGYRATTAFERAIFPAGHPDRPPADEKYLADVAAATLDQVKAFHAANYGPAACRIVLVGDIDDRVIDQALTNGFAGWRGGKPIPRTGHAPLPNGPSTVTVEMPGKTSVSLVIGQPSELRYSDPNYQSLNMATAVFGSGFFTARLLANVRNREGLTYGIDARLSGDTYADGAWFIEGTFAPELLAKGRASTMRQLEEFCAGGVTAEELANFKVTLTGTYKVALSTTGGLASALLNALQRGYGPEWVDEYPRRLEALSLDQVNDAVHKLLHPDKMVTIMAGSTSAK